jgi:short-subunit dehydrogenase
VIELIKKKVLITGCGSGFGKEAAIELAKRGHIVYATTHYESQAIILNNIAKRENLDIHSFKLDILDKTDRTQILDYDIDVLICNAAFGNSGSVSEVDIHRIERVFQVNVFCNIRLIQLAIKAMIEKNKSGRIIFISSMAGRIPIPFLSPYCASKSALESFAICLEKELKLIDYPKIQVSIIQPGAYDTGFNKKNIEKKWNWMRKESIFQNKLDKIHENEEKFWRRIEIKDYTNVVKTYIKAVEADNPKFRYCIPWYQAMIVQLGRIFGM